MSNREDGLFRKEFELIAYQGGAGERPANTKEAFNHAVGLSPDIIIDLDLQPAKDQTIMVIHDETLDRTTNGSGLVSSHSADELKQFDAGFQFRGSSDEHSFRGKGITIPTLEEVLKDYSETRLILDIQKNDSEHIRRVLELVENCRAVERVIVVSEMDEVIDACRDLRPDWTYGAPTNEATMVIMGAQEPLSPVFMIPEFYQGMPVLSPELITTLHQHGKKVWVWTVNEPGDFLRLKQEGVDGVFTKFPEHMATQLEF